MYFDDFYGDAINLKFNQEELIKILKKKLKSLLMEY